MNWFFWKFIFLVDFLGQSKRQIKIFSIFFFSKFFLRYPKLGFFWVKTLLKGNFWKHFFFEKSVFAILIDTENQPKNGFSKKMASYTTEISQNVSHAIYAAGPFVCLDLYVLGIFFNLNDLKNHFIFVLRKCHNHLKDCANLCGLLREAEQDCTVACRYHAKLFLEAKFFVIIFTTWQWSTQQASSMSEKHGTSMLSTLGHFGPIILPL